MNLSVINLSPMSDLNDFNDQTLIDNIRHNAIIANAITPKLTQITFQRFSQCFGIFQRCNFHFKIMNNSLFFRKIHFIHLFQGCIGKCQFSHFKIYQALKSFLLLLENKVFLLQNRSFLVQQGRGSNLLALPKNLQRLAEYNRFWCDGSLWQDDLTVVQHLPKILTIVNPLDTVSWGAPLLFLDGDDLDQIAWAKRQDSQAKWVLVKGKPLDLQKQRKRAIYFDQGGLLVRKFGIKQVPCRITQQAKSLKIEEIKLTAVSHG